MIGRHYMYKGNRISPPQFLMLVMLRKGPMYGYEVLKVLREEFQGFWEPQTGAIYPALKRLEEGHRKHQAAGTKKALKELLNLVDVLEKP